MSIKNWNAGIVRPVAVAPTGPYENSAAPGMWTLDQVAYWRKQGLWPTFGNIDPSAFIESLFSTYLYTGNGSTQTITNGIDLAGEGGLTWIKARNDSGSSNMLFDTARGAGTRLSSNQSNQAFSTLPFGLTTFGATGFTVADDSIGSYAVNGPPGGTYSGNGTYASWTFRKQPKFFDVVTYTGAGAAQNIAHSLGSVPGCIIVKTTNAAGYDWLVYHRSTGNTNRLLLNDTAPAASGTSFWNDTTPTSTVFTVGSNVNVNQSGNTYVAYLFAHDAGGFGLSGSENVVSCGSYAGSASSVSVTLGYEPQWLIIKPSTTASGWTMVDNMRGMPVGGENARLYADASYSEGASVVGPASPTATGFTVAPTDGGWNAAGQTYIYIAIRRGPMKVPTDGTKVFNPAFYGTNGIFGYLGAPTDMSIYTSLTTPASSNPALRSRLVGGGNRLTTSNTDAEVADATNFWDNMLGANPSGEVTSFNSTRITFNFRRAPSFFDEVCYTGTGVARTVAHNLAAVPELMIVKTRSNTGGYSWYVYTAATGPTKWMRLNGTNASANDSGVYWNSTSPTSTVFSLNTNIGVNGSGDTYVAYLFATCAGVSKVGSYTGTGTTQAINCGFTAGARFVLIKRTDSTGDWYVWDSARGIVAGNDPYLLLNSTAAEVTGTDYIDTSAAGFEITSTAPDAINANGGTFIFLAIS